MKSEEALLEFYRQYYCACVCLCECTIIQYKTALVLSRHSTACSTPRPFDFKRINELDSLDACTCAPPSGSTFLPTRLYVCVSVQLSAYLWINQATVYAHNTKFYSLSCAHWARVYPFREPFSRRPKNLSFQSFQ